MGELVSLIQQYLDKHGVRWAAFARNIGTIPQTVNKWKTNPGTFPEPEHLKGVARVTGVPYLLVLDAVLKDAGYRDSLVDDQRTLEVRIARAARESDSLPMELIEFLERPDLPDETFSGALGLHPEMTYADIRHAADEYCRQMDRAYGYGHEPFVDMAQAWERLSDLAAELSDVGSSDDAKARSDADIESAASAFVDTVEGEVNDGDDRRKKRY
jgi:hypothetical protein